MAEILRFVDPNSSAGGDGTTNALTGAARAYVSLNAWEAATQQDLTDGGGDTARVVCSSDDAGSTHLADTTAVTIDGWTTDATRYIQIEAASSHGGKWNDSIYRLIIANSAGLNCIERYTRVYGLQVNVTAVDALYQWGINVAPDGIVAKCIVKGMGSSTAYAYHNGIHINADTYTFYVYDNIIYDWKSSDVNGGIGVHFTAFTSTCYFYNNTIYNCTRGMLWVYGSITAINNIIRLCDPAASGTFAAGTDYNATDNASMNYTVTGSGNTHDRLSQTFTFVNEGADDFHLASNDAGARDYGVTDPGSGLFSDDIDGQTRTGTWDIGADEYVAAGGSPYESYITITKNWALE